MLDWHSDGAAAAAWVGTLFCIVTWVVKTSQRHSRVEQAEIIVNTVLLFFMAFAVLFLPRWGVPAVFGLQAFSLSVFFILKPQLSRMDFLLLAMVWPMLFYALASL